MLINATNLPNSNEIPRSCSLNLAVKNFFCWFCNCCCCCCCWRFSLRLPCLGSEIFFSWGCWPPITRPFEQWPLLRWPPLIPPFGKSLWKINKGLLLYISNHVISLLFYCIPDPWTLLILDHQTQSTILMSAQAIGDLSMT